MEWNERITLQNLPDFLAHFKSQQDSDEVKYPNDKILPVFTRLAMALLHLEVNQYPEAEQLFQEAIAHGDPSPYLYAVVRDRPYITENPDQITRIQQALAQIETTYGKGKYVKLTHRLVNQKLKAIVDDIEDTLLQALRSWCDAMNAHNYAEACQILEAVLPQEHPQLPDRIFMSDAWLFLAISCIATGQTQRAEALIETSRSCLRPSEMAYFRRHSAAQIDKINAILAANKTNSTQPIC